MALIARIDEAGCVGCGLCMEVCPADAIQVNGKAVVLDENCINCGACVDECSQDVISLVDSEKINRCSIPWCF